MIGDFHFLRPSWVLALVPCALLVWAIQRREDATQSWQGIVAPHLLPFLLQDQNRRARFHTAASYRDRMVRRRARDRRTDVAA
ncbi:MAG: hypothetical protein ABW214_02010 [Terrimicrobiaceae bacterium]|jgi:Ca-activated chloride channel family protein